MFSFVFLCLSSNNLKWPARQFEKSYGSFGEIQLGSIRSTSLEKLILLFVTVIDQVCYLVNEY